MGQPLGNEEIDPLVCIGDQRVDRAKRRKAHRIEARLFAKLAPCGVHRRLSRVELACRKFDEYAVERIAELALDDEAAVGKDRHHQRRTRVDDVLARRERTIRKPHGVAADVQELAVEHRLRRHFGLDEMQVSFFCVGLGFTLVAHSSQSFCTRKSV